MICEYLDDKEPLTLDEVKVQCRVDFEEEDSFLSNIVIPAARSLAEEVSGAAIRYARYVEHVSDVSAAVLGRGCVLEVESVSQGGTPISFTTSRSGRHTVVHAQGAAGQPFEITYTAGIAIANHPGVRAWMLLAAAWLYANRELLSERSGPKEPPYITKSLLSSINVHPGF